MKYKSHKHYSVYGMYEVGVYNTLREARIVRIKEINLLNKRLKPKYSKVKISDFKIIEHTRRRVA